MMSNLWNQEAEEAVSLVLLSGFNIKFNSLL